MDWYFRGKTAVVTGGASGMGLLSGENFFERCANVVLCDCDEAALENAAGSFVREKGRLLAVKCDVRKFEEVKAAVDRAVETFGSLDIMVNCAGGNSCRIFGQWQEFCDRPIEQIR